LGVSSVSISIPPQQSWRLELEQYIQLNDDLPRDEVIQLAPFALSKKLKSKGISEMFSGIHPGTPKYHRPWFWWKALVLSGMDDLWFADEFNRGELSWRRWVYRILVRATDAQLETLLRRLYREKLWVPHAYTPKLAYLWTKGGSWFSKDGMSRILVLKEHLERPDCYWKMILGDDLVRIEKELMSVAHPDKMAYPQTYYNAIEYVRNRTKSRGGKRMGYGSLPWFFQQPLQREDGKWITMEGRLGRVKRRAIVW